MNEFKNMVRVSVLPELLGPMIMKSTSDIICLNPLPSDAEFRGWAHDPSRNCLSIFYEHPSFDPVRMECEVPEYRLEFQKIIKSRAFYIPNGG